MKTIENAINHCKTHLELNSIENCISPSARDSAKFKITDAKLHVPIVVWSTRDNVNLTKQLSNGFKRSAYWNNYLTIPVKVINQRSNIYELLSASFEGVKIIYSCLYYCWKCCK